MPYRAPTHSEQQGRKGYDQAYAQQGKWHAERTVYTSERWRRLRVVVLRAEPLCADPYGWHAADGRVVPSTQVDHKVPLRVDRALAYVRSNLQAVCGHCHGVKTRADLRRWPVTQEATQ